MRSPHKELHEAVCGRIKEHEAECQECFGEDPECDVCNGFGRCYWGCWYATDVAWCDICHANDVPIAEYAEEWVCVRCYLRWHHKCCPACTAGWFDLIPENLREEIVK